MGQAKEPLWDWTLRRIRRIWPLGDSTKLQHSVEPDLPDSDLQLLRSKIDGCLESRGGEVTARARAAELGETYLALSSKGRHRFLELLASEYDVDNNAVDEAIERRRQATDPIEQQKMTIQLRNLLEPSRSRLLRQFNELQEGVKFLVDMRAELILWAQKEPGLLPLDQDVYRLLASWFDVGFLERKQITWDTPASLLEKLTEYEAVHAIRSWGDLKHRLAEDRRCYAYFHPSMPDEPLIFVEVALVNGISSNIHELLDEKVPGNNPEKANTAIFYSISNCQRGLAGVNFGNFLIKRVVADLASTLPNIKTFSTLSPIPGFMSWLRKNNGNLLENDEEKASIAKLLEENHPTEELRELLTVSSDSTDNAPSPLQWILLHLCAHYLLTVKRKGKASDPVANFHLSNGAGIERINWAADLSDNGIKQSAGMMVNYLYSLPDIEKNHEDYTGKGDIFASATVRKLIRT